MRRSIGTGAVMTLLVVGAWRAASEWLLRLGELRRTGSMERRLRARRVHAVARALERAGVPATTPQPTPLVANGLLADAMVTIGAERVTAARDRAMVEAQLARATGQRVSIWAMALVVAALVLTLIPLVRPLEGPALWLALGAVALLAAALVAARRR